MKDFIMFALFLFIVKNWLILIKFGIVLENWVDGCEGNGRDEFDLGS